MATKPKSTTRPAAKKAAKSRKVKPGYMGKSETVPLVMAAREAFDYQKDLGNLDDSEKFDDWRRNQVADVTGGRKGLTDCQHVHFRPLMARFKLLAGKDDQAFAVEMKTGKVMPNGSDDDTREEREKIAFEILRRLREHCELADTAWPLLLAKWDGDEEKDGDWINRAMSRKLEIEKQGGPIREGYLVSVVKMKTRRPDLNLGRDLLAGLAERCTIKQLRDLLSTIVNRINSKEGVGTRKAKNRKQKTKPEREKRSVKTLAPRALLPDSEADPRIELPEEPDDFRR